MISLRETLRHLVSKFSFLKSIPKPTAFGFAVIILVLALVTGYGVYSLASGGNTSTTIVSTQVNTQSTGGQTVSTSSTDIQTITVAVLPQITPTTTTQTFQNVTTTIVFTSYTTYTTTLPVCTIGTPPC